MNTLSINVGEKLFSFHNFAFWCNKAPSLFRENGVTGNDVICLDQKGRICQIGRQFMRARDEDTFPIDVYRAVI